MRYKDVVKRVVERPPEKGKSCLYVEVVVKCGWHDRGCGVRDDPDVCVPGAMGIPDYLKIRMGMAMLGCLHIEGVIASI